MKTDLICLCGSHAAGKEMVKGELLRFFGEDVLERVVPCTTRPKRPSELHGREYYFVTEEEFSANQQADELVFWSQIRPGQRSGTLKRELFGKRRAVVDVTPRGARAMRQILRDSQRGDALLVFIYASAEERRERIKAREGGKVSDEKLLQMMNHDPVDPDPDHYPDFDLLVENPDGRLDDTVSKVIAVVRQFLRI